HFLGGLLRTCTGSTCRGELSGCRRLVGARPGLIVVAFLGGALGLTQLVACAIELDGSELLRIRLLGLLDQSACSRDFRGSAGIGGAAHCERPSGCDDQKTIAH